MKSNNKGKEIYYTEEDGDKTQIYSLNPYKDDPTPKLLHEFDHLLNDHPKGSIDYIEVAQNGEYFVVQETVGVGGSPIILGLSGNDIKVSK